MTGTFASGRRPLALFGAMVMAAGLASCGDVDDALFGSAQASDSAFPAPDSGNGAKTVASSDAAAATDDNGAPIAPAAELPTVTVQRIAIAEGSPTGTAVGQKVTEVRTTLMGLQDRIEANAGRLATLRQSDATYSA